MSTFEDHESTCPVCAGLDAYYDEVNLTGDILYHEYECPDCESMWKVKFAYVEITEIVDGRA